MQPKKRQKKQKRRRIKIMDLAIIDQSKPGVPAEQIDLVEKVLDYAGEYMKLPADTEMSVTFVNNDEIQR